MKTSVALLTLSLFYLCVAEVQQPDDQAGEINNSKNSNTESACVYAGNVTESQKNNCQLVVILRELEAKLRSTEKQLDDLRREVRGKNILNIHKSIHTFQVD